MIFIENGDENDLRLFFDAHNGTLQIDFDLFKQILSGWNIYVIKKDFPIAILIEKNGSAHIAACKNKKVGVSAIREVIKMLNITKTTVENEYKKSHALCKRLGFNVEKIENGVTFYSMGNV